MSEINYFYFLFLLYASPIRRKMRLSKLKIASRSFILPLLFLHQAYSIYCRPGLTVPTMTFHKEPYYNSNTSVLRNLLCDLYLLLDVTCMKDIWNIFLRGFLLATIHRSFFRSYRVGHNFAVACLSWCASFSQPVLRLLWSADRVERISSAVRRRLSNN